MIKKWVFIALFGFTLLIVGLVYWNHKPTATNIITPLNITDFDIVFGSDKAPVRVFMFFDYFCSHCRKFFIDEFPKIEQEFIITNKVQLVLKPVFFSNKLPIVRAYKSAICLNKHGRYNDMHQLLLVEPEAVFSKSFNDLIDDYVQRNSMYAECMYSGTAEQYLDETRKLFIANKFKGTPTFIINNKIYTGYLNYNKFKQKINN